MAASKRALPAIAIALAIVAVVMLAAALYLRRNRTETSEPAPPADAAVTENRAPDAAVPANDTDAPVDFVDPWAVDAGSCRPCDSTCTLLCTCRDDARLSSYSCVNGCCTTPEKTCAELCVDHGGEP